jgi:hypothetical protein
MIVKTGTGSSGRDLSVFIQSRKQKEDNRKRMSCNGRRVLCKGCSDTYILWPCLQWIESPEAEGHTTVFVANFFGCAGLMAFISAWSQALLYAMLICNWALGRLERNWVEKPQQFLFYSYLLLFLFLVLGWVILQATLCRWMCSAQW